MNKTFLLALALLSISFAHAKSPISVYSDTVTWDITDSLKYLPAYEDYCHWEQTSIWRKRTDLTSLSEEIELQLLIDSCQFSPPVLGRLSSDYGWRRNRPHYGVDIKLQVGDTVSSVFEGVVRIAKYSRSYGNVVVVRHSNGLETLYAHLSKLLVAPGDVLDVGSILGLGGNTGRSFGSHLHFEVRYLGEPFNPHAVFEITDSSFLLKDSSLVLDQTHFALSKKARSIKYHYVKSGDSLWRISNRRGVSINKLCRLNKISKKSTLRIGQRIRYN